jgi:hypothetical protein
MATRIRLTGFPCRDYSSFHIWHLTFLIAYEWITLIGISRNDKCEMRNVEIHLGGVGLGNRSP